MWPFLFSLLFGAAVAVSLLRAVRQFRCYETLPEKSDLAPPHLPTVAAIVPVRNEERNIDACLQSLMTQDYPRHRLRIIIVDDGSSDNSAAIIRRRAAADDRVRFIEAGMLPDGWTGKCHACWQGALAAESEWLCFIDADTIAQPALLGVAVAAALRKELDMLSLAPFQELTFFFDRLVVPLGLLGLAVTQDLARVNAPSSDAATANGQCILIRARSYFAVNGHASVQGEICEDAALTRRIKAARLRFALLGAERLIRTRMYGNLAELWEGLSKNVTETYGGPAATLAVALAAALIGWTALLLPAWALLTTVRDHDFLAIATAAVAVPASLAVFATAVALARHLRIPFWYGLLCPLGCLMGAAIAVNGVLARALHRVAWKGRVYADPRPRRRAIHRLSGPAD